jgi:hypothetical protein
VGGLTKPLRKLGNFSAVLDSVADPSSVKTRKGFCLTSGFVWHESQRFLTMRKNICGLTRGRMHFSSGASLFLSDFGQRPKT